MFSLNVFTASIHFAKGEISLNGRPEMIGRRMTISSCDNPLSWDGSNNDLNGVRTISRDHRIDGIRNEQKFVTPKNAR